MMQEPRPTDFRPIADLTPSIANRDFARAGFYLSNLEENQELLVLAQVGQRLSQVKTLGFLGDKDIRARLIEAAESRGLVERHSLATVENVVMGAIEAGRANPTAGQAKREPDGPIPLIAELADPVPFPVDSLGPDLAPAAMAIAAKVQAPLAIAAQSCLAAAALVAQSHADVQMPFGQPRPLSLFFITIAASGDRKSTTDKEALWPIKKREAALSDEYKYFLADWKIELSAWTAEKKKNRGR